MGDSAACKRRMSTSMGPLLCAHCTDFLHTLRFNYSQSCGFIVVIAFIPSIPLTNSLRAKAAKYTIDFEGSQQLGLRIPP